MEPLSTWLPKSNTWALSTVLPGPSSLYLTSQQPVNYASEIPSDCYLFSISVAITFCAATISQLTTMWWSPNCSLNINSSFSNPSPCSCKKGMQCNWSQHFLFKPLNSLSLDSAYKSDFRVLIWFLLICPIWSKSFKLFMFCSNPQWLAFLVLEYDKISLPI